MTIPSFAHYVRAGSAGMAVDPRTRRAVAGLCAAAGGYGVAFGVLGRAVGLPAAVVIAMSVVVYAGGSQMALLGVLSAGGAPIAGAAGGLVLNSRLLAFGAAAAPLLRGRPAIRLAKAYLLTDEAVAVAMAQRDQPAQQRAFWFAGLSLWATWQAATVLGVVVGGGLADPTAVGLDAALPAAFLVLLVPMLRSSTERRAAAGGAVGALVGLVALPPGLPVLLAMAAGVLASLRLRGGAGDDVVGGPSAPTGLRDDPAGAT